MENRPMVQLAAGRVRGCKAPSGQESRLFPGATTTTPGYRRHPSLAASDWRGTGQPRKGPEWMHPGKPRATEAQLPCGRRRTREANATTAKAKGKAWNLAASATTYNPVDTSPCDWIRKNAHAGLVGL